MSDRPTPSLYGDQPEPPKSAAPGLADQILGVFTSPVELFQRLNRTPSWGLALGLVLGVALVLTVVWGLKVDVDEMLRPALEKNPQIASSQIDLIVAFYKKFIVPLSVFSTLFFTAFFLFVTALFYWLVGKSTAETEPPSYRQALSAVAVPSLVRLPSMLLVALICLAGTIGGLTPEKISPTSVGYFVQMESAKGHALLYCLDLFFLAEAALLFLSARHTMRLKTGGAAICVLITLALGIGLRVLGAK
jgi:Yip1 domain